MTPQIQPGTHLDADRMAALLEGALTERERAESLAHLAECELCRGVAFLAQAPEAAPQPAAKPFFAGWFDAGVARLVLAGALAVAMLLLSVALWPRRAQTPGTDRVALAPKPPAVPTPPVPAPNDRPKMSPPPSRPKPPVVAAPRVMGRMAGEPAPPPKLPPPAPVVAGEGAPMGGAIAMDQAVTAGMAGTPAAKPQVPKASAVILGSAGLAAGRGVAAGVPRSAAAAPAPPPPSAPMMLRMEHGNGFAADSAAVQGTVVDASGAIVPGATVTLRAKSAVQAQQARTDAQGRFKLEALQPGSYDLRISAPGFETVARTVNLSAGEVAQLDSKLPVGMASQTVEVASAAAEVMASNAEPLQLLVPLPGGQTVVAQVDQGGRSVALDSNGELYLLGGRGKRWKKVKPAWPGKVASIAATPDGFSLTTEGHTTWASPDGRRWSQK